MIAQLLIVLSAILVLGVPSHAEDSAPTGGRDLIDPSAPLSARGGPGGSAEKISLAEGVHRAGFRVKVTRAHPDRPWDAGFSAPFIGGSVKKGDRLLVRYQARCLDGSSGNALVKIQLPKPSYATVAMAGPARFGAEWEQIDHAVVAERDATEGGAEIQLILGAQAQVVEIAGLRVVNYGADYDLSKIPNRKVTYQGRAPDAPWRKEALARISQIRMADYAVQVVDASGKPVANSEVTVELKRHEFGFGTCVTRRMINQEGPDGERYRDIVRRTCSRVVFENDYKPSSFPKDEKGLADFAKSHEWLKAEGIPVRAHYLMQDAVDEWTRAQLGDPVKLRDATLKSVRERIAFAEGRVTEWDVINHPIAWEGAEMLADKGTPLNGLAMEVWNEARRLTKLPLLINEDQLFREGAQQEKTFELLARLKREGIHVDGLGNQAHINSSFLPTPEDWLRITDRFATVVPKQVITEYDISTNGDDELAADYLRDSLIACFSHPAYDGFLLWGFWEGSHWIPQAALWNKDWSIKPAGRMWEKWIGEEWHTRVTLKTDAEGTAKWRGFKGSYQIVAGDRKSERFQPGAAGRPFRLEVR